MLASKTEKIKKKCGECYDLNNTSVCVKSGL